MPDYLDELEPVIDQEYEDYTIAAELNSLAYDIHEMAKEKGFWPKGKTRNVGELLMLITSELSEGLEAHRTDAMDSHLPERMGLEVELADALIRILDMAEGLKLDIGGAVVEKLNYNKARPPKHGKNY